MFVKKVFQLVKPFLVNLHSTGSKKYSCMCSMTPNFLFFFNIWVSKKRRISRRSQIRGNSLKKVYLKKGFVKNLNKLFLKNIISLYPDAHACFNLAPVFNMWTHLGDLAWRGQHVSYACQWHTRAWVGLNLLLTFIIAALDILG